MSKRSAEQSPRDERAKRTKTESGATEGVIIEALQKAAALFAESKRVGRVDNAKVESIKKTLNQDTMYAAVMVNPECSRHTIGLYMDRASAVAMANKVNVKNYVGAVEERTLMGLYYAPDEALRILNYDGPVEDPGEVTLSIILQLEDRYEQFAVSGHGIHSGVDALVAELVTAYPNVRISVHQNYSPDYADKSDNPGIEALKKLANAEIKDMIEQHVE